MMTKQNDYLDKAKTRLESIIGKSRYSDNSLPKDLEITVIMLDTSIALVDEVIGIRKDLQKYFDPQYKAEVEKRQQTAEEKYKERQARKELMETNPVWKKIQKSPLPKNTIGILERMFIGFLPGPSKLPYMTIEEFTDEIHRSNNSILGFRNGIGEIRIRQLREIFPLSVK